MAKESKQLSDLFKDTLKDIYFAEKKILTALPKMEKAAQSPDLKKAFEKHHREAEGQIDRLENVFRIFDMKAQGKTCEAIMGIMKEGQEIRGRVTISLKPVVAEYTAPVKGLSRQKASIFHAIMPGAPLGLVIMDDDPEVSRPDSF
jgi:hypothetical protein